MFDKKETKVLTLCLEMRNVQSARPYYIFFKKVSVIAGMHVEILQLLDTFTVPKPR
jgi:hypothetical protein